jgi:hypothetical protein
VSGSTIAGRILTQTRATRKSLSTLGNPAGALVTVMQKVPLSKPLKYHDKSHKKSLSH